ncbi:GNAT family N-acetyltransferase [Caulobacter zeae]|uniref:GNAT family N-acetyltransferase n=1 Tax=Caulobacter zeae TaxID=2055137 RepID=A0A2N5DRD5_9CAUL|nr:bifunctional acetyl coenzyme A synthetase (ADP forming), alpha domain/GNAT family N-acetyltransferase [Caulobacter zeae]PLR28626.1 GNAT family N-acetyltransferase [Caulobacter zeae]
MSLHNLHSLLSPSSIAIVGGSDRPGSVGKVVLDNILSGGFTGEVFVINPRPQTIVGAKWLADCDLLPAGLDLAVVVVPARVVPETIASLAARKTAAAMVISGGVTKASGLQGAMLAAAETADIRIIGPNGLGLVAPHGRLNASFARSPARPGRLGLISQSGALVSGLIDWANARDLGFSAIISAGDMADVDLGDMIDLLAADPHTDAILLYVEGVREAAKLLSAAHAATRSKPVIVLKAGKTEQARRAAVTHTGALAGDAQVHRCAFERAGMVVVDDLRGLFEAAEALRVAHPPKGPRLAIVTNGGGLGVLALDAMATGSAALASLSQDTLARLSKVLPPTWSHANPVDLIGDADGARYKEAIAAVLDDDGVDALLVMNCPTALNQPQEIASSVADAVLGARDRGRRQPIIGCWLGDDQRRAVAASLERAQIPVFETPDGAVQAFNQLLSARARRRGLAFNPALPTPTARKDAAQALLDAVREQGRTLLTEIEAKDLLRLYGIPAIATRHAATIKAVGEACAALPGPYVVKIISADLPHKSDVGGVALDLVDADAAVAAAEAISQRMALEQPHAQLDGFAVETMAHPGGHDLIVGLGQDPTFGPVLLVGDGGKAVEVLADTALDLPPIDRRLARAMVARTRVSRLLAGYRDEPAADIDAVASVLEAISAMACDLPDLASLDINPLRVGPDGVLALDARIIATDEPMAPRLAIMPAPPDSWAQLTTRMGLKITVRPAGPDDMASLDAFFMGLSPEDLRLRFLSPMRRIDQDRLSLMCDLDYRRAMTFLAFDLATGALVATAMLASGPDPDRAEVAVAVRSDLKGQGLGWTLLDHTLNYARARGVQVVESLESADNAQALQIEAEMGFSSRTNPEDRGLRIVEHKLAKSRLSEARNA